MSTGCSAIRFLVQVYIIALKIVHPLKVKLGFQVIHEYVQLSSANVAAKEKLLPVLVESMSNSIKQTSIPPQL